MLMSVKCKHSLNKTIITNLSLLYWCVFHCYKLSRVALTTIAWKVRPCFPWQIMNSEASCWKAHCKWEFILMIINLCFWYKSRCQCHTWNAALRSRVSFGRLQWLKCCKCCVELVLHTAGAKGTGDWHRQQLFKTCVSVSTLTRVPSK